MVDFGKVEERGKADMARAVTKEMELASRQYWLRHDQVIAIADALQFQATAMELLNVKTRGGHLPAEVRRFADTLLKEWDDAPTWPGCRTRFRCAVLPRSAWSGRGVFCRLVEGRRVRDFRRPS